MPKIISKRLWAKVTVISLAIGTLSPAASQDFIGFDRSSFGSVVLSKNQSVGGSDIELELAVGSYNNESIRNYSEASIFAKMGQSVGRLDILTDAGVFPCTAFIVDKKHILTNYHCVPGILDHPKANATRIEAVQFVAGYTQQGVTDGTRTYNVSINPIEAHEDLDYAILEVFGDPSREYGALKLAANSAEAGDPYWVIGHPMGEAQRISREKCRANAPALADERLLHTCDTLPGNSGSPVIDASLQMVVGLHHAGSKKDSVNFAVPMSLIIARSNYLTAALDASAPPAPPPTPPIVETPVAETPTPTVPAETEMCDSMYAEAKGLDACFAFEAYVEQCKTHRFRAFGQGYLNSKCKIAVVQPDPPKPDPDPQPEPEQDQTSSCDAMYAEAKATKACSGYLNFVEQCRQHPFRVLGRGFLDKNCDNKVTDSAPEPVGPPKFAYAPEMVALDSSVFVAKSPVTVGQFREFVQSTNSAASRSGWSRTCRAHFNRWNPVNGVNWERPGYQTSEDHPVTCVSYNDAVVYTNWLSEKTGLRYRVMPFNIWNRLAAQANAYPDAVCSDCAQRASFPQPVGSAGAAHLGVQDALGNVWQWMGGCSGAQCQMRGGAWDTPANVLTSRSFKRDKFNFRTNALGFRVVYYP